MWRVCRQHSLSAATVASLAQVACASAPTPHAVHLLLLMKTWPTSDLDEARGLLMCGLIGMIPQLLLECHVLDLLEAGAIRLTLAHHILRQWRHSRAGFSCRMMSSSFILDDYEAN